MESTTKSLVGANEGEARVLIALVAHELRTPLSTLSNAAAVLRSVLVADPVAGAALEMILRQTRVLTRLVDDLLDPARIETGQLSANFESRDLNEVLTWAARSCESALEAHGHCLQITLSAGSIPVVADFDRLVQVFMNLLGNAIKYTPQGGRIYLNSTIEGQEVVVRLRDSGVGMNPATLPQMFDLFAQDHSTQAMSEGGVGIGLALVHQIVGMHHGTVRGCSEGYGKGSEFIVRLPLQVQVSRGGLDPSALPEHEHGGRGFDVEGIRLSGMPATTESR